MSITTTGLSYAVAAEIRAWMGRRGVRQSQLARTLGENEQWLSTRLRGATPLNINDVGRIAEVLGLHAIDLLPQREREVTVTYLALPPPVVGPSRPGGRRDLPRPVAHRPPSGPGRTSRVHPAIAA